MSLPTQQSRRQDRESDKLTPVILTIPSPASFPLLGIPVSVSRLSRYIVAPNSRSSIDSPDSLSSSIELPRRLRLFLLLSFTLAFPDVIESSIITSRSVLLRFACGPVGNVRSSAKCVCNEGSFVCFPRGDEDELCDCDVPDGEGGVITGVEGDNKCPCCCCGWYCVWGC